MTISNVNANAMSVTSLTKCYVLCTLDTYWRLLLAYTVLLKYAVSSVMHWMWLVCYFYFLQNQIIMIILFFWMFPSLSLLNQWMLASVWEMREQENEREGKYGKEEGKKGRSESQEQKIIWGVSFLSWRVDECEQIKACESLAIRILFWLTVWCFL